MRGQIRVPAEKEGEREMVDEGPGEDGGNVGERLGDARILIPAGYARVQRDSEV